MAGRISTSDPKVTMQFSVPADIAKRIRDAARSSDLTLAFIGETALTAWLDSGGPAMHGVHQ